MPYRIWYVVFITHPIVLAICFRGYLGKDARSAAEKMSRDSKLRPAILVLAAIISNVLLIAAAKYAIKFFWK